MIILHDSFSELEISIHFESIQSMFQGKKDDKIFTTVVYRNHPSQCNETICVLETPSKIISLGDLAAMATRSSPRTVRFPSESDS